MIITLWWGWAQTPGGDGTAGGHHANGVRAVGDGGAACAVAAAGGCGSTPEEPPHDDPVPSSIELTPAAVSLVIGRSQQLTAVVRDADGVEIASATVTYTSGDTAVARVSATGLVSAVGAGSGTITVRCSPASATTIVTVANPTFLSVGSDKT